ncbi:hypothetical protein DICVIV_06092 [Dictyocaulus viviparus]|uniref:CC domain-containing protein n=1 Tax=Dictyocaulus viviparus TaxID=29172 RepID=A0A0D8XTG9_DICVI|nr:hypothetical protein DICVIV_06092 [Dictyocaulus viviparus]
MAGDKKQTTSHVCNYFKNVFYLTVPSNPTSNCVGCAQPAAPQILALQAPICPGGGYPVGQCHSGYCSPGYSCHQNVCCPSYSPILACPSGSAAVGTCVNGACATGYSCIQNHCCPTPVTKNPFVCPNGNQAAGGCVNGQCGAGYTCRNGLCCAGKSSSAVKCLDGSEAVGACIPSCYGDTCGGLQITYYCGAGYTCTTGNICCPVTSCPEGGDPIGPPVNGLCPQGYSLQGSLCCSNTRTAKCPDGSNGTQPVNDICPTGTTLVGNICCPSGGKLVGVCETPSMGIGPCTPAGCGVGYACDNSATNPQCCPVVNYRDPKFQIGPAVSGMCPVGYVAVYPPSSANPDGTNDGVCVDLQTVPGLCAVAVQSGPCNNGQCPTGFTCNTYADICCPTTTTTPRRHYVEQNTRHSHYGRPVHNYIPIPGLCAVAVQSGPCNNGQCPTGFTCNTYADICCPTTTTTPRRHYVEQNIRHTHYGRPVHNYIPTRFETCYDGSIPFGRCINGLCGIGHKCQNGLCCSPSLREESSIRNERRYRLGICPNNEYAVSSCFPNGVCGSTFQCVAKLNLCCPPGGNEIQSNVIVSKETIRPIGARCIDDKECVGYSEGLSLCHAGVCQCSPVAYTQGIACVRRKHLIVNDSPSDEK